MYSGAWGKTTSMKYLRELGCNVQVPGVDLPQYNGPFLKLALPTSEARMLGYSQGVYPRPPNILHSICV